MQPVSPDTHFPKLEEEVLQLWKKNDVMLKGLRLNQGKKRFVFYDGPPFATGLPHYGHILAGTLKDIVPRYWAMKGFHVERRWGWDCHGLPVEFEMEKELSLSSRGDVEKYGVDKFNESCRGIVQRYTREWEEVIYRTGRWVDFRNNYRTMDPPFMETVWWVVKQLWDKGWVYEGYRVMPYSWRISTPLSNFEASLNYKEVQDPALTIKFKGVDANLFYLAWTTTPWTLPSNLALSVHPELKYVELEDLKTQEHYVLAEARINAYYASPELYRKVRTFTGTQLAGKQYEPLFPYFSSYEKKGAFRILAGEHVAATEGTGIVHTAPAFGEEDYSICQKHSIPVAGPVDDEGKFTSEVPDYVGQNVKEADKAIIKDLKQKGRVLKHETVLHNYPFCWRSDTPLIYRAISTWFVKLDPIKPLLIANNQKTHWVPEHLRDGRFGNWLENARDWNISRNRFWGTPIPVWKCACGEKICVGSIEELKKLSGKAPQDLHKHFVDKIEFPCPKCKKTMSRIPEVLDCWFESGSMPYGQAHYPFEHRQQFEDNFPADFIAEGIDQTRGWFYTLSVLSSALFGKPPFKHVMVNGLILAEDGKKMSKRLKNYPDPMYIMGTYGADALRAYLMNSPASHAEDLRFSESGVKEIVRSVILPLWNAYSFFVTYAIADGWKVESYDAKILATASKDLANDLANELDRWVLSRLQTLVRDVENKMSEYHLYEVVPAVLGFIDELTNWYIRLNRRRFWEEEKTPDKTQAYSTLYYVLTEFSKVLAPILPFLTESIYQNLRNPSNMPESIHLSAFPEVKANWLDETLENRMRLIQTVISMGRNLRAVHKMKTRQPLTQMLVITKNPSDRVAIERYTDLLCQELNVKKVSFSTEESKWVKLISKPNAKVLGPRLGGRMKEFFQKLKDLTSDQAESLERDGWVEVAGEKFTSAEVAVEREPKQEGLIQTGGKVTVWLDTAMDQSLIAEGKAREFVNRIQKLRKDLNLNVTDRIQVEFSTDSTLSNDLIQFSSYISQEVLATSLKENGGRSDWSAEQDIDGTPLRIWIQR